MLKIKYLFVGLFFLYISCKQDTTDTTNSDSAPEKILANQPIEVEIAVVKQAPFEEEIYSEGFVVAQQMALLSFEQSGYIEHIKVSNGEQVAKGQIIAQQKNTKLALQLQEAELKLAQANREFSNRQQAYLIATNQPEIPEAKQLFFEQESGLSLAKINHEKAKLEFEQSFVKAPFSGVINNLSNEYGHYPAGKQVAELLNINSLNVVFAVFEKQAHHIKPGQQVAIKPLFGNQRLGAQITAKASRISPNGLLEVTAVLKDNRNLIPGQKVDVYIKTPATPALWLPKNALVTRSGKEVVFAYQNQKAQWRYVQKIGENADFFAVLGELNPADTVISSNNINLSHDTPVRIKKR